MRYFDYVNTKNMGSIWNLFSGLSGGGKGLLRPNTDFYSYSHSLEIINSALNGNIDLLNFDITSYEIACSKNNEKLKGKKAKKESTIVDATDNEPIRYGEISSNSVEVSDKSAELEEFKNKDHYEYCLSRLVVIRKKYLVEEGIDVVNVLENSLKCIPEALSSLKSFIDKDEEFEDIVVTLCENSNGNLLSDLEKIIIS